MIIGITGGIGSGKSIIARALAARGYAVYDCDREAKRIIAENKDVQQQIIALLGSEAFVNGVYNTSYVAQRVFAEPELLERLNQIVHPAVKEDILEKQPDFVESAILYEAGLDAICDKIFVIEAPEDIRIARAIARDYHGDASPENIDKVRARVRAQRPYLSSIHSPLSGSDASPLSNPTLVTNDGRKSIDELAEEIIALLH